MSDAWTEPPRVVVTAAAAEQVPGGGSRRVAALILGIASVVVGVIAVVWPQATVAVVAVLFGLQLLVYGVVQIVRSFAVEDAGGGARMLLVLLGLLSIVASVLCLRHLLQTVTALTLLVGLFWLVGGLIEIARTFTGWTVHSGLELVGGLLGALAGLVVLCWPRPTVLVLAVLFGAWLVVFGVITIVAALRSNSAHPSAADTRRVGDAT